MMKIRLPALLLAVLMVFSLFTVSASAADFTPRTTEPSAGDTHYYSNKNKYYNATGNGTGSSEWYAYGRAYEILGAAPNFSGKGYTWVDAGYETGKTPELGAIAHFEVNNFPLPPVDLMAVVEKIEGDEIWYSYYNNNTFQYTKGVSSGRSRTTSTYSPRYGPRGPRSS